MASGTRVPVETRESVSSCALSFRGRDGVSMEKEESEAESHCRSEKYPSAVSAAPPSTSPASRSPGWPTSDRAPMDAGGESSSPPAAAAAASRSVLGFLPLG